MCIWNSKVKALGIGKLWNTPIYIHWSLIIGIIIFIIILYYLLYDIVASIILSLTVVPSVLLHELFHLLVAKKYYKFTVDNVTLCMLGGFTKISSFETINITLNQEALIKIAGPIANIIIALLLLIPTYLCVKYDANDIIFMIIVGVFGMNIGLAGFNLLPIYGLDGAGIFHCIIHRIIRKLYNICRRSNINYQQRMLQLNDEIENEFIWIHNVLPHTTALVAYIFTLIVNIGVIILWFNYFSYDILTIIICIALLLINIVSLYCIYKSRKAFINANKAYMDNKDIVENTLYEFAWNYMHEKKQIDYANLTLIIRGGKDCYDQVAYANNSQNDEQLVQITATRAAILAYVFFKINVQINKSVSKIRCSLTLKNMFIVNPSSIYEAMFRDVRKYFNNVKTSSSNNDNIYDTEILPLNRHNENGVIFRWDEKNVEKLVKDEEFIISIYIEKNNITNSKLIGEYADHLMFSIIVRVMDTTKKSYWKMKPAIVNQI